MSYCSFCDIPIDERVSDFSMRHFSKPLCRPCQENYKRRRSSAQQDVKIPLCRDVSCDIFIGEGVGMEIVTAIKQAKNRIDIISPYLSNPLVETLIAVAERGVKVRLLTNNNLGNLGEKSYKASLRRLIPQRQEVDKVAQAKRGVLQRQMERLRWAILIIFTLTIVLAVAFVSAGISTARIAWLFTLLVPMFILWLTAVSKKRDFEKTKIYSYHYSNDLFRFSVFREYEKGGLPKATTIHSKVYVVDDVAYLGSVNLTRSGTEFSYETVIKTAEPTTVSAIVAEVDKVLREKQFVENTSWVREKVIESIYEGMRPDN